MSQEKNLLKENASMNHLSFFKTKIIVVFFGDMIGFSILKQFEKYNKVERKISLEKVFEKEYKVKLVELETNKEGIITHFFHNSKNGVSHFFKKDAVKYTKEIKMNEHPKRNGMKPNFSKPIKVNTTLIINDTNTITADGCNLFFLL